MQLKEAPSNCSFPWITLGVAIFFIELVIELISLLKVKTNLQPFSLFYGVLGPQIPKNLAFFSELLFLFYGTYRL